MRSVGVASGTHADQCTPQLYGNSEARMITEQMLAQIEFDLHAGPTFTALFKPFFIDEEPMFLLSVIRYKRNPTWDSCLSIYLKHIRSESDKQANIPSAAKTEIESYIKFWSDKQKGLDGQGVKLHMGPAKADIFDLAFRDVFGMFTHQLDTNAQQAAVCQKFLTDFQVTG
jgi:hypothetical protein